MDVSPRGKGVNSSYTHILVQLLFACSQFALLCQQGQFLRFRCLYGLFIL